MRQTRARASPPRGRGASGATRAHGTRVEPRAREPRARERACCGGAATPARGARRRARARGAPGRPGTRRAPPPRRFATPPPARRRSRRAHRTAGRARRPRARWRQTLTRRRVRDVGIAQCCRRALVKRLRECMSGGGAAVRRAAPRASAGRLGDGRREWTEAIADPRPRIAFGNVVAELLYWSRMSAPTRRRLHARVDQARARFTLHRRGFTQRRSSGGLGGGARLLAEGSGATKLPCVAANS